MLPLITLPLLTLPLITLPLLMLLLPMLPLLVCGAHKFLLNVLTLFNAALWSVVIF
jgi:hypothetical protein